MKVKIAIFALIVLLAVSFVPVSAGTAEGDRELAIAGSFSKIDDADSLTLQVSFGYFATAAIEVRASVGIDRMDLGSGFDTVTVLTLGVDGLYHFNTETDVLPYVGAGFLYSRFDAGDFDESAIGVKGILGVKFFVSESTSLNLEYNYIKIFDDDYEDADTDVIHLLLIQISFFF